MRKPFFSIVTCTFNSGKFISKNINSVKKQTFQDWEHIFIDGKSKDSTLEAIKAYREKFPSQVRLYSSEPRGISSAMNVGLKKARGKYLIFLHSDDSLYNPKVLQNISGYLKIQKFPDWIFGKINVIEAGGKSIGVFPSRWFYEYLPISIIKYFNVIPHQAVFIKKIVFDKFGYFDESLSSAMDIDLWLRIYKETRWKFFNGVIANFSIRPGAQSSSLAKKEENDRNIFRVEERYLNGFEMRLFKLVKKIVDCYNKTRR